MAKAVNKKSPKTASNIFPNVTKAYVPDNPKEKQKLLPDTIIEEINNAVRRLNKILKPYQEVGEGLETQIQLNLTDNGLRLYYTLNNDWSASIKKAVKDTIIKTAAKYPQIIVVSTPYLPTS